MAYTSSLFERIQQHASDSQKTVLNLPTDFFDIGPFDAFGYCFAAPTSGYLTTPAGTKDKEIHRSLKSHMQSSITELAVFSQMGAEVAQVPISEL